MNEIFTTLSLLIVAFKLIKSCYSLWCKVGHCGLFLGVFWLLLLEFFLCVWTNSSPQTTAQDRQHLSRLTPHSCLHPLHLPPSFASVCQTPFLLFLLPFLTFFSLTYFSLPLFSLSTVFQLEHSWNTSALVSALITRHIFTHTLTLSCDAAIQPYPN